MTSNPDTSPESTKLKDGSHNSFFKRRTMSSSFSNPRSFASDETGESSKSGSQQRNSMTYVGNDLSADALMADDDNAENKRHSQERRWGRRNHKSKSSGAFLLSNAAFESSAEKGLNSEGSSSMPHSRATMGNPKGNAAGKLPDAQQQMGDEDSTGGRALSSNVPSADFGNEGVQKADRFEVGNHALGTRATAGGFNVDSTQIVNLALNLSESRRNAPRRIVSTPLPQGGLGESTTGGSLRRHLQAQRRVSRNISPKADRGDRVTNSARNAVGARLNSPMQTSFDAYPEGGMYHYHFSASTLARAERAKVAIELMAQYRRLLQYVPPLRPQLLERPATASPEGSVKGSPTMSKFPSKAASDSGSLQRQLGRPYNPLQYIRNRKVRARTSRAIDGEAQGFGDVVKVSSWVDQVAQAAFSDGNQPTDCLSMPAFSKAAEDAASPHASPQSSIGKSAAAPFKIRRPRIDWITNPADMLADVFWLEQDDNKKIIEDRDGHKIFPPTTDLKRPFSRRSEEPEQLAELAAPDIHTASSEVDLRIDTQLPEFRSVKTDSGAFSDGAVSRARHKFREVRSAAKIHHSHNGSQHRHMFSSHSRSNSDSSDSEGARRRRHRRSGTAESNDQGRDILEKQMQEMIAKEARNSDSSGMRDVQGQRIVESIERQRPPLKDGLEKARQGSQVPSRSGSLVAKHNRDSTNTGGSSGRASLEVPGYTSRRSLEGLDSTAPNSPQTRAARIKNAFIPSIGMDLSSSGSRHGSPSRRPLSRVRSKMGALHERNSSYVRNLSRSRQVNDDVPIPLSKIASLDSTEADSRRRSSSPFKKIDSNVSEGAQPQPPKRGGSLRKGKEEESGIRGLFKSARNPVSRVSDLLWKKSSSPVVEPKSGFSTDESDLEDIRRSPGKKGSRESSTGRPLSSMEEVPTQKEAPSHLSEMPTFSSPFERRGRQMQPRDESAPMDVGSVAEQRQAREERRKRSRANLLEPTPRIEFQGASPSSSPERLPKDRFARDSSASDVDSRRGSFSYANPEDARLDGLSGKRRNALPVTGLAGLEVSQNRRPSLGNRQWSISDRGVTAQQGPMTKREIARVRALLLSSGIKAKEIIRRSEQFTDLHNPEDQLYSEVALLSNEEIKPVPKKEEHRLAARILSDNVQLSSSIWSASADEFVNITVSSLVARIDILQARLVDTLTPATRKASDEADEVSRDLVTRKTLQVKGLEDRMEKMLRKRRRRFRWLRRGGWVLVEWGLVGVMWYVWFVVMICRIVLGIGKGMVGVVRWLFWL